MLNNSQIEHYDYLFYVALRGSIAYSYLVNIKYPQILLFNSQAVL